MNFDLQGASRGELETMYGCAAEATAALAEMAERGTNPVTEALAGAARVEEWAHFPPGDAVDPAAHCQFYYHAHAADERAPGEHGHFHVFVRPQPGDAHLAHLTGISLDEKGLLLRLFTTNAWVTGESWQPAAAMVGLAGRFATARDASSPALGRWICGIIGMFRPQIAELLRARDARVADVAREHPENDALENRALHITSEMPADFLGRIRAIEAALCEPGREPAISHASFSA